METNVILKFIKSQKTFLIIFFIAFFIRAVFALIRNSPLSGDELFYETTALNIMSGYGYSIDGNLTARIPPGYSIFLSFVYSVFGHHFIAIRIVQAIIDALMCAVIYLIAKHLFNEKIGILAGILCASHYFFLKAVQLIRPDTLQMFFIVISVLYWIRWRDKFLKKDAILLGLFSSIAVMLKANIVILPFIFILIEFFNIVKNKQAKISIFFKSAIIIIVVFLLPIIPWAVRNYKVYHAFVPLATDSGTALYSSYNPPEGKKFGIISNDTIMRDASKIKSETERSKYLTSKTKEYILSHKKEVMHLLLYKVLFFWSIFDWETLGDGRGVYNFSSAFILLLSILGLIILRRRMKHFVAIITPIAYMFLLALIFQGLPRFRMPIEPFLIIFASFFIIYLFDKFSKKIATFSLLTWFFINFTIFLYTPYAYKTCRIIMRNLQIW